MRFFFVDPARVGAERAQLDGDEAQHIKNVLRLRPGDEIGLLDGAGHEYSGVIAGLSGAGVEVRLTGSRPAPGGSRIRLSVAQGFLKEKKMDRLAHQLSELGVHRWVPFVSERAVARPDLDRTRARQRRWHKIALEALKQCRRSHLMAVDPVADFERILALSAEHELSVLFWEENAGMALEGELGAGSGRPESILLVIGPEGGFTAEEARAAAAAGFRVAGLGPRVMKAETAAVAACAIVQHLFGDLAPGQKNLDKNGPIA